MTPGTVFRSDIGYHYMKLEDGDNPARIISLPGGAVMSHDSDVLYEVVQWRPPNQLTHPATEKLISDMAYGRVFCLRSDGSEPFMRVTTLTGHELSVVDLRDGRLLNFHDVSYPLMDKDPVTGGAASNDATVATSTTGNAVPPSPMRDVDHLRNLVKEAAAHLFSRDLITAEEYEELTS